ncbi:fluoride efflux transporter CrcB [Dasania marina]|uniref:fluoride efflux transporter CrcB n=1 Tax=Dasania marina TaxID=471499 RepID=UPI00037A57B3|nr:fluoride efflux transporter CrcB [Dasania marina]|tara:strand:+ start:39500 stop:39877 length:378 start_codon:yes stop_codon:yes gene_type:complete
MKQLLFIALGGAGGAVCRYGLVNLVNQLHHSKFPLGTFSVNVIGSFVIGVMYVLIAERLSLSPDWRSIIIVGFLGAFTTFSTFSLEAITLLENGHAANAALYIVSSLLVCLLMVWLAMLLTRAVF